MRFKLDRRARLQTRASLSSGLVFHGINRAISKNIGLFKKPAPGGKRLQGVPTLRILTALSACMCMQCVTPLSAYGQAGYSNKGSVDTTVPGTALPRYEGLIPSDITNMPTTELPTPPGSRASYFRPWAPGWTYNLPSRLWWNSSIETAQRYDCNVFQTKSGYISDYSFRVQPRVQVGWRFNNHFEPYAEYFVIKDVHTEATNFNPPTSQSVAGGVKGALWASFNPDDKGLHKTLSYDMRFREWWFNSHQRQYDLLPTLIYEHVLRHKSKTNHTKYDLRAMLQIDQRKTRDSGTTHELDPFFSARIVHVKGKWVGSAGVTVALDYPTYTGTDPKLKTGAVIGTIDISRQIPRHPHFYGFVQGQPIWNFSDQNVPGYSGFNFRLFSGVRMIFDRSPVTPAVRAAWKNIGK